MITARRSFLEGLAAWLGGCFSLPLVRAARPAKVVTPDHEYRSDLVKLLRNYLRGEIHNLEPESNDESHRVVVDFRGEVFDPLTKKWEFEIGATLLVKRSIIEKHNRTLLRSLMNITTLVDSSNRSWLLKPQSSTTYSQLVLTPSGYGLVSFGCWLSTVPPWTPNLFLPGG